MDIYCRNLFTQWGTLSDQGGIHVAYIMCPWVKEERDRSIRMRQGGTSTAGHQWKITVIDINLMLVSGRLIAEGQQDAGCNGCEERGWLTRTGLCPSAPACSILHCHINRSCSQNPFGSNRSLSRACWQIPSAAFCLISPSIWVTRRIWDTAVFLLFFFPPEWDS